MLERAIVGFNCAGLIPEGNEVIARYDINADVQSETTIYIWLASNSNDVVAFRDAHGWRLPCSARTDCRCIETSIPVPNQVNMVDPANLGSVRVSVSRAAQYRGVVRFDDAG